MELVSTILSMGGFEIIKAFNGKDCLDKWKMEEPDLILLDIMMPDLSGWDVYQRIRKSDSKQKVAFLSALDVSEDRLKQLKKEGIADYIVKPFDSEDLVNRVKSLTKNRDK